MHRMRWRPGRRPNSAGGAHDAPPRPLVGWGGGHPLPNNSTPSAPSEPRSSRLRRSMLATFGASFLAYTHLYFLAIHHCLLDTYNNETTRLYNNVFDFHPYSVLTVACSTDRCSVWWWWQAVQRWRQMTCKTKCQAHPSKQQNKRTLCQVKFRFLVYMLTGILQKCDPISILSVFS